MTDELVYSATLNYTFSSIQVITLIMSKQTP